MGEVGLDCLRLVVGPSTRVSNFRLILQLRLPLGSLMGGELRLKLIVVLFQCLLTSNVIAVESGLLPVAI